MNTCEFPCSGMASVIEEHRWWASKRILTIIAFAGVGLTGCAARLEATPGTTAAAPTLPAECIPVEQGPGCLPVAPSSARVDLNQPSFSDPTQVDNPWHPSALVRSVVYLGMSGGEPFRSEVTLLPTTRTIEWNGQQVEVLESQYIAYVNGRLHEAAIDWYAQADDGSVWYFGEDVFNYEDGLVADTHGTWLAGRDGPAAMIMPASPNVGDVYRPENIPGVVFEEVAVQETGVTVDGPLGPVPGAIVVQELHMDGSYEEKTFAPGYGEFSTGSGNDLEAMALAAPTNARPDLKEGLAGMSAAVSEVYEAAGSASWTGAEASLAQASAAWEAVPLGSLPPRLEAQVTADIAALGAAIGARSPEGARQAALDTLRSLIDIELLHLPPVQVDRLRFENLVRQLALHASIEDAGLVAGDTASLEWVADRFLHVLADADRAAIDGLLAELRAAAESESFDAAADIAAHLQAVLAPLPPLG